jgi:hypothetical protein
MTPTDAMTLLRGDALRSGRNTTKCASRPISAAMANEIAIAGSVPRGSLSLMVIRTGRLLSRMARSQPHSGMMSTHGRKISPAPLPPIVVRRAVKVRAAYMAIAPWAKLMTPEPRYATTRPVAKIA